MIKSITVFNKLNGFNENVFVDRIIRTIINLVQLFHESHTDIDIISAAQKKMSRAFSFKRV